MFKGHVGVAGSWTDVAYLRHWCREASRWDPWAAHRAPRRSGDEKSVLRLTGTPFGDPGTWENLLEIYIGWTDICMYNLYSTVYVIYIVYQFIYVHIYIYQNEEIYWEHRLIPRNRLRIFYMDIIYRLPCHFNKRWIQRIHFSPQSAPQDPVACWKTTTIEFDDFTRNQHLRYQRINIFVRDWGMRIVHKIIANKKYVHKICSKTLWLSHCVFRRISPTLFSIGHFPNK